MTIGVHPFTDAEHVLDARERAITSWYTDWYAKKAEKPFGPQLPALDADEPWFEEVADTYCHVASLFPLRVDVASDDGSLILPAGTRAYPSGKRVVEITAATVRTAIGAPELYPPYCRGQLGVPRQASKDCYLGCEEHRHLLPDPDTTYPFALARCAGCEQWFYRRSRFYQIALINEWVEAGWWAPSVRKAIRRVEAFRTA